MVWIVSVPRPWVEILERELERRGIPFLMLHDAEDVDRARTSIFRPRLIFVGQTLRQGIGVHMLVRLHSAFPEAHLVFVVHDPNPEIERIARQARLLLFGIEPLSKHVICEILDQVFRNPWQKESPGSSSLPV